MDVSVELFLVALAEIFAGVDATFREYANHTNTIADTDTVLFFHTFGSPKTGTIAIQIPKMMIIVRFFIGLLLYHFKRSNQAVRED